MMKKIFCALLMCSIVCLTFSTVVYGEETKVKSNNYETISYYESENIILYEGSSTTYKVIGDNNGNIFVFDSKTNQLLTMAKITIYDMKSKIYGSIIMPTSNYESWNPYSVYQKGKIEVADMVDPETIASIIVYALKINPKYTNGISVVLFVANEIANLCVKTTYFVKYFSTNLNCGVLQKTYSNFYKNSNYSGYIGKSEVYHEWMDTPWNYENPAPCRTLVNTYPYA